MYINQLQSLHLKIRTLSSILHMYSCEIQRDKMVNTQLKKRVKNTITAVMRKVHNLTLNTMAVLIC